MALNTKDVQLITDMNQNMKDDIMGAIEGLGSGIRAKMESEVDRIDEMDKIRNSKIQTNGEEIKKIKKETFIARWVQRNRRLTIMIALVAMFMAAWGYHTINFKRTVEKVLKIELNDDQ